MPMPAKYTKAKRARDRKAAIKALLDRGPMSPGQVVAELGLQSSDEQSVRQIMSHMKLDRLEDGRYAARPVLCGARLIELTDVSMWADDCLRAPPPSLNGERNWV